MSQECNYCCCPYCSAYACDGENYILPRKILSYILNNNKCSCNTKPKIFKETGYRFIEFNNASVQECTKDEACCCNICVAPFKSISIKTCLKQKKLCPAPASICSSVSVKACEQPNCEVSFKSAPCSAINVQECCPSKAINQKDVNINFQLNMQRKTKNKRCAAQNPPVVIEPVMECKCKEKKKKKKKKETCDCKAKPLLCENPRLDITINNEKQNACNCNQKHNNKLKSPIITKCSNSEQKKPKFFDKIKQLIAKNNKIFNSDSESENFVEGIDFCTNQSSLEDEVEEEPKATCEHCKKKKKRKDPEKPQKHNSIINGCYCQTQKIKNNPPCTHYSKNIEAAKQPKKILFKCCKMPDYQTCKYFAADRIQKLSKKEEPDNNNVLEKDNNSKSIKSLDEHSSSASAKLRKKRDAKRSKTKHAGSRNSAEAPQTINNADEKMTKSSKIKDNNNVLEKDNNSKSIKALDEHSNRPNVSSASAKLRKKREAKRSKTKRAGSGSSADAPQTSNNADEKMTKSSKITNNESSLNTIFSERKDEVRSQKIKPLEPT